MGRVCIKDHRPEQSLGGDGWLNGCAQCEVEWLRVEIERALQSEHEGWRYASELEEERKRLTAEVERLRAQHGDES